MITADRTDAGTLRVPVQIQELPQAAALPDAGMELTEDELEAVVGGLARVQMPQFLLSATA